MAAVTLVILRVVIINAQPEATTRRCMWSAPLILQPELKTWIELCLQLDIGHQRCACTTLSLATAELENQQLHALQLRAWRQPATK